MNPCCEVYLLMTTIKDDQFGRQWVDWKVGTLLFIIYIYLNIVQLTTWDWADWKGLPGKFYTPPLVVGISKILAAFFFTYNWFWARKSFQDLCVALSLPWRQKNSQTQPISLGRGLRVKWRPRTALKVWPLVVTSPSANSRVGGWGREFENDELG